MTNTVCCRLYVKSEKAKLKKTEKGGHQRPVFGRTKGALFKGKYWNQQISQSWGLCIEQWL